VFLTGDSGAGKTLFCLRLAALARQKTLAPVGLLSPGAYQAGSKGGIDLLDVQSGERRRLANRRPADLARGAAPMDNLGWIFDPAVLEWGNQILTGLAGGELLIIDELGPLELLYNTGWTAGLDLLDERRYWLSVVVIRPSLLEVAQARWPWGRALQVEPGSYTPVE